MPGWLAIASKDLQLLARDRMALFWVLGFPLLFAAFFGSIMKAGAEADTIELDVIVAGERGATAGRLHEGLSRAGMRVQRASLSAARDAVRRGEAIAFVRAVETPEGDRIELAIDPARRSEAALLEGVLLGLLAPAPARTGAPRIERLALLTPRMGPQSGFEIVFPMMVLWGLLGCAAAFAIAIVGERANGTLLRLRAAPIGWGTILLGKTAACAFACALDAALLGLIGFALLSVRVNDGAKFAAAVAACAVCFTGITMLLSTLGKSEQAVAGAGWSTLILLAMLGGAMVPLAVMPEWLLSWSELSPVRWGIRALEGAAWRGFSWAELVQPLFALSALGAVAFAAGLALLRARGL